MKSKRLIALVCMLIGTLLVISGEVHASPELLPTLQPTSTQPQTGTPYGGGSWGVPTQAHYCTPAVPTATNLLPTIIFPTLEGQATGTPTTMPTFTLTPTSTSAVKLKVNIDARLADTRGWTRSGNIQCTYDGTGYINVPEGGAGNFTAYKFECLGYIEAIGGGWYNTQQSVTFEVSKSVNSTGGIPYYFDAEFQFDGNSSITENGTEIGYTTVQYSSAHKWHKGIHQIYKTPADTYGIYVHLFGSVDPLTQPTQPAPTAQPTVTPFGGPCVPLPDYNSLEPVAWLEPLSFRSGGCWTLVPGVTIPLPPGYGLPDNLIVQEMGICFQYVDIVGQLMGIQFEWWLVMFVGMGVMFAVFNEFRS